MRSLDVAKGRSLYGYVCIALFSLLDNLVTDVLAFTIAIRPDDEETSVPSLIGDVLRNSLLVLRACQHARASLLPRQTYIRDGRDDWCCEQRDGRRRLPVLIGCREICSREVAQDGCHGDIAVAVWLAKVEAEGVVLDELVGCVVLQRD